MTDVRDFYRQLGEGEWARLARPLGSLEFMATMRLIDRYIPVGMTVCDVGAGPGRYSIELLRRGHRVTLIDLTPELLELARARIDAEGLRADALLVADARDLSSLPDEHFDAALIFGPLYHLDEEGRRAVLAEVRRILKPGGIALMTYLNSWGLIRTGLTDFPWEYQEAGFLHSMRMPRSFGIWHCRRHRTPKTRCQARLQCIGARRARRIPRWYGADRRDVDARQPRCLRSDGARSGRIIRRAAVSRCHGSSDSRVPPGLTTLGPPARSG